MIKIICKILFYVSFSLCLADEETSSSLLKYGWDIDYEGKNKKIESISSPWNSIKDLNNGYQNITYKKNFTLLETFEYLILPPSWVRYEVFLNDQSLVNTSTGLGIKTRIYATEIIKIPKSYLKIGDNSIKIVASGEKNLGGFKNDTILFSSNNDRIFLEKIRNLFVNDIHILFACLALIIGILCFILAFKIKERKKELSFIGLSSLTIIPYNLLCTELFSFIFSTGDMPFRLNLSMSMTSFPCYTAYIIIFTKYEFKSSFLKILSSYKFILGLIALGPIIFLSTIFLQFELFQSIIFPVFFIEALFALIQIYVSRNNFILLIISLFSVLAAILALMSDLHFLNIYILGHACCAISITSIYILSSHTIASDRKHRSLSEIIQCFLPKSAYIQISDSVNKGYSLEEIRKNMVYSATVGNVFVDICDWGLMNEQLPKDIVIASREYVFHFIGTVLEKYKLEMVKTIGDNVHFACGLQKNPSISDSEIALYILSGISELLDEMDNLNSQLKSRLLPMMKIKISATIGPCSISLDGYQKNIRFDIHGHWVNVAKRYEEFMNHDFYQKYGKNVSIVSHNLVTLCTDMKIRIRFSEPISVIDKHQQVYQAYVGRQYSGSLKLEDFVGGVYGQFSHK